MTMIDGPIAPGFDSEAGKLAEQMRRDRKVNRYWLMSRAERLAERDRIVRRVEEFERRHSDVICRALLERQDAIVRRASG